MPRLPGELPDWLPLSLLEECFAAQERELAQARAAEEERHQTLTALFGNVEQIDTDPLWE